MFDLDRRGFLKGVSTGGAGLVLAPLVSRLSALADGTYVPPRRVVFLVFDNGLSERGVQPVDLPRVDTPRTTRTPIRGLKLPFDIEPLTPFQDRITVIQGLRGHHLRTDHGGGFRSLSGLPSASKVSSVVGESIDAALAKTQSTVFPLLPLGISANIRMTNGPPAAQCSSAWGANKPISLFLRPENAYESLFGSVGSKANDFARRRKMLDFISGDVKRLRTQIAGPEKESLDQHLAALESLSQRNDRLAGMLDRGELRQYAPELPSQPPTKMTEIVAGQCDIAAAALISGLTNVVTIVSGLCALSTDYSGISNYGTHALGHGLVDPESKLSGAEILSRYHNFLAGEANRLLQKLEAVPEPKANGEAGTMLDNTLLVFMSDSANRQHTHGENWPVVLVGDWGGRIAAGQVVTYPLTVVPHNPNFDINAYGAMSVAAMSNPLINALYCTLLHAAGAPRETFNRAPGLKETVEQFGPLSELLG
jgi:hypothetical protein